MNLPADLDALARTVIDTNRYMVLGTTEPDSRPRVSPVYFTHAGYRTFYWVSSPSAHHSRNIDARPSVALAIYDSTAEIGQGRCVYIEATATAVPDEALPQHCAKAFANVAPGAKAFRPEDLMGDAPLRLYLAQATKHDVHVPGRDPSNETGLDIRREVNP
ncbi:MAG: pyridoxamine 5'-phosphate oxidase family protein [Acidimicrobiia bacterium]